MGLQTVHQVVVHKVGGEPVAYMVPTESVVIGVEMLEEWWEGAAVAASLDDVVAGVVGLPRDVATAVVDDQMLVVEG